ncbi:MAG: thioredoxin family protein [Planctomycetes bacterium]|nr:thioredoxin family protein [Planctomycetota bacterium]
MRMTACFLAILAIAGASAEDLPPVFSKLNYEQARAKAKTEKKTLIVKATATWCGPCKQMDKTSWLDERIVKWVQANGLAIQLDVDEQAQAAKSLEVGSLPTMIAFKNDAEFDRVVGYQDADTLLAWLERVKAGKRAIDEAMELLAAVKSGTKKLPGMERLNLAKRLAEGRKYEEATDQFFWLWEKIPTEYPELIGVRGSFMIRDLTALAEKHKPARERLIALRDATAKKFESETKRAAEPLRDWIVLNQALEESQRTIEWFDRVKDNPDAAETIGRIDHLLLPFLEDEARWADMGKIDRKPVERLRKRKSMDSSGQVLSGRKMDPEMRAQVEEAEVQLLREEAGRAYAAQLAAGNEKLAAEVAETALELDDSPAMRIALVQTALRARQPRAAHEIWLNQVEKTGEDVKELRDRLKKLLAQQKP